MFKLSNYKHIGNVQSSLDYTLFGLIQNQKFNCETVQNLIEKNKEISQDELFKNDCYALGIIIKVLMTLDDSISISETNADLRQIVENLTCNRLCLLEIFEGFCKDFTKEVFDPQLEPYFTNVN
jgi:hypothetical protein